MPLEVGSTVARLGAKLDERGFDEFDRRMAAALRKAADHVEVPLKADVDERGFNRYDDRLKAAERQTDQSSRRMRDHVGGFASSVTGRFAGVGVAAAGMAAIAGGGLAMIAKDAASAASDINESLTKNQVLFGDYAKDVEKFASTSARQFGISKAAALDYAGVFGNLARAIGIPQQDAAKLSVRLTRLAADMASFNNTSIDDALEALRSGLVGETEPLRRFGVTLSANAVAAEAMRSGIVKVKKDTLEYRAASIAVEKAQTAQTKAVKEHGKTSLEAREATVNLDKANQNLTKTAAGGKVELTNQQKAAATTALIFRQTSAAQGDFARTSGGAANQARILSARADDLRAKLGDKLLPIQIAVTKGMNSLLDGWEKGKGTGGALRDIFEALAAKVSDTVGAIRDTIRYFREHRTQADLLLSVIGGLVAGFGALRVAMLLVAGAQRVVAMFSLLRGLFIASRAGALGYMAAQYGVNAAILANPIGLIIVALVALGAALVIAWKRSATFRAIVRDAFDAVRHVVLVAGGQVLKFVDIFLGAVSSIAGVASHLPGVGDKFKGIQQAVDNAREGLRKYRTELGETDKQHQRMGHIRDLAEDMVTLRKRLDSTRKGTDDYRDAAEALRKKQGQLNAAIDKAKPAADKAGKGFKGARTNALNLANTVEDAGGTIADVTNAMLREFGVKPLSFKTRRRLAQVGHDVGITQDPAERAVGGIASPYGGSSADDHLLIDPYGRPVAAMSGTEGILNRPQMGIVDQALALTAAAGVQPYAGLGALWGSGMRHYETGGALARATQLDRMDLPYVWGGHHGDRIITDPRPGLDCSSTVSYVLNIPPRVSGAFENYGQPGEGPITIAANPTHVFMRIGSRFFGTSHENPGGGAGFHSPRSFAGFTVRHVSGDGIGGAGGEVPRVMIDGPAGALRSIAQGASDKMRAGANAYLSRQLGALDNPAGQPLDEGTTVGRGAMTQAQARAVAAQALRMTGHYSAANVAGLVRMGQQESGLIPSRVQEIHDVNSGGNEARGWLQVTPGTFRANMMPGHGNIFDPLDNALASIRYQFAQYGHIVGHSGYSGGGLLGGLRRFAGGGLLSGGRSASKSYTELSRANASDADRYSALESRYGTTAPDLIYPDGSPHEGEVNQRALSHRLAQMQSLVDIREATVRRMQEMRRVAAEVARRYHELVARLQRSLAHARGKKRDGVRRQIKSGQAKERTWSGRARQLGTTRTAGSDLYAAYTDLLSIRGEFAEVAGTQPTKTDTPDDTGAATDTSGADTSSTADTAPAQAAPDPAEVARQALEQVAAFQAGRAALFGSYGANFRPGGAGPLDTVGAQAAGTRFYGGDTGGADGGVLAGAGVTQNVYLMGPQPADPHTFTAATLHELKALV